MLIKTYFDQMGCVRQIALHIYTVDSNISIKVDFGQQSYTLDHIWSQFKDIGKLARMVIFQFDQLS